MVERAFWPCTIVPTSSWPWSDGVSPPGRSSLHHADESAGPVRNSQVYCTGVLFQYSSHVHRVCRHSYATSPMLDMYLFTYVRRLLHGSVVPVFHVWGHVSRVCCSFVLVCIFKVMFLPQNLPFSR